MSPTAPYRLFHRHREVLALLGALGGTATLPTDRKSVV